MKLFTKFGSIALLSVLTVSALASNQLVEELVLDSNSLRQLEVNAGAGDLSIQGDSNSQEITVEATIQGKRIDENDYELYLRRHGDKAFLYAHFNKVRYSNSTIDLIVTVPQALRLRVQDSSGNLNIEGMRSGMRIDDSSGDLHISDVVGDVIIEDSSGDIELVSVEGSVDIEDKSGDIDVRNVSGNVSVKDGSGDIDVYTVGGTVTAEDGSGDITVSDANKFTLQRDGSGKVNLHGVNS